MKAQSFFGGTNTKNNTVGVKQVGHSGQVKSKTTSLPIRETVKQAKSTPAVPHITWVNSKQPKDVGSR